MDPSASSDTSSLESPRSAECPETAGLALLGQGLSLFRRELNLPPWWDLIMVSRVTDIAVTL
jgi:hypothetical protein